MMRKRTGTRTGRKGVAVLEVMVGMVVLAIGLLGVAGMTVSAARRATGLSSQASRDGILLQELNRLSTLPYDSLGSRAGCTSVTTAAQSYLRCIAVAEFAAGTGYKRVQIVITPATTYARPDTVFVYRARGVSTNPLGQ